MLSFCLVYFSFLPPLCIVSHTAVYVALVFFLVLFTLNHISFVYTSVLFCFQPLFCVHTFCFFKPFKVFLTLPFLFLVTFFPALFTFSAGGREDILHRCHFQVFGIKSEDAACQPRSQVTTAHNGQYQGTTCGAIDDRLFQFHWSLGHFGDDS